MKIGQIISRYLPWAPMGGMNVQYLARQGIGPSAYQALAGKYQGMDTIAVNDGELDILFERRFDDQPPHHRSLPDDAQASIGYRAILRQPGRSSGTAYPAGVSRAAAQRHHYPALPISPAPQWPVCPLPIRIAEE
ncbi:hypothetical protein [Rhizobium mesosinicum]|uniref:Uncharacterized protein n=1 Tax=Rhizobium mesosinicum TaxID=335017 RepID=A0ABS7GY17_9HYPH|nr:hypothetical protein [Rhizobium mesosinicum]